MAQLLTLDDVSHAYGLQPLLDHVKLQIHTRERVCLIGRNGEGKSTLLKIIEGTVLPDSGLVWRSPSLRIARLAQELPTARDTTVYEFVAEGLAEAGKLLAEYHTLTQQLAHNHSTKALARLEVLQRQIESNNGWQFEQSMQTMLTRLELDGEKLLADLSGGWQRRAALARALVASPDLLLLDEPTNHLDIAAIEWLQEQLLNLDVALLFITHDRALLQRLATRIIELDRGQLTSWPGDYANFLRHKAELLQAEEKHAALFDKKLAQEEAWIRQGIKARRTRNEGRVRALYALRAERQKRREVGARASFTLNEAERSGQVVITAKNISHAYGERVVIRDFSIRIMRMDRIGLVGPNGAGKTTLLNILLQQLTPDAGEVTLGSRLQIGYFDQLRALLDKEKTVIDNVAQGREFIDVNGKTQHIMSYLTDFLFTPARALTPVKALSGGECHRLLLARLFSQPSNLLVMDEPTNDLDIETLELLEELLANYQGTVLVVSHDRAFLDHVVTSTLQFSGDGHIQEYVGSYQQAFATSAAVKKTPTQKEVVPRPIKKMRFKEQKELAELPKKIEDLERQRDDLQSAMLEADFYKQTPDVIAEKAATLKEIEKKISEAYQRWERLDE